MKKLIIISSLFVIVSCTNEMQDMAKVQAPSLYCFTDNGTSTKTSISVDTDGIGTIYWNPADSINVFFGTEGVRYYSVNDDTAVKVKFNTTEELNGTKADFKNIWGLYPYNPAATSDGISVKTTIPASQKCIGNSFETDLFPMLAHSTTNELHFKNICGGIKFSLSRDDIKTITFKGNNDEDIAGSVRVEMDENNKPLVSVESGEKMITLTPRVGSTFDSGTYYYIVILPCMLTDGFTMTFETNEEIGTLNYDNTDILIRRSVFGKKENIDSFASFKVLIPEGVVDLGLSVLWATCNIGATSPEEYGDYYAWGETEPKSEYTSENYKWLDSSVGSRIKYGNSPVYGEENNQGTLDLEDDVAYIKLGRHWRMPTCSEIEELYDNCSVNRKTINGVNGFQCISKKNGNSIFFPAAGFYDKFGLNLEGSHSYNWSSTCAICIHDGAPISKTVYYGMPVRPVYDADIEVELPENPADGIIDLGLSVKWRSRNLGADSPEQYGSYYQWAGTCGYSDPSINIPWKLFPYGWVEGNNYHLSKYYDKDNKRQLDNSDDAATHVLGAIWRIPTYKECWELMTKCTWTKTCINGIGGYKIQSNVSGYNDKWIFLPAAGKRTQDLFQQYERGGRGRYCYYWTSTLHNSYPYESAQVMDGTYDTGYHDYELRYYALPIRPVTN